MGLAALWPDLKAKADPPALRKDDKIRGIVGRFLGLSGVSSWGCGGDVVWAGAVELALDAHLSDDETVAKMGHPALRMVPGFRES